MKGKYLTVYANSYAIVKSFFKEEMTFEEAERIGKEYCLNNGYDYINTEEVEEVEDIEIPVPEFEEWE